MSRLAIAAALSALATGAAADAVSIVDAQFQRGGDGLWRASVTLRHADTGWEHYADAWRVVGADDTVYGERTLHHPHVDEQPFTRSLSGIDIPAEVDTVLVEAHDKVHGWSDRRLTVSLPPPP